MKYEKYPEDHKAFYESYYNKKLTKKDYEWAMKEDKWLDDVLDGIAYKAPKKPVQEWTLITKEELLKKHGSGTMWIFKPHTRMGMSDTSWTEMRVKKINLSYAGSGFTYKHDSDVMDLGVIHKDTTRGMWETFVASGEYVEYNGHQPQDWNHLPTKGSNYALEA